jgi:lysophospholipase L1-like esterase
MFSDLTSIIAQVQAAGASRVAVLTTLTRSTWTGTPETTRIAYNDLIKAITTTGVDIIDVAADPLLDPKVTPGNFADGIHPNAAGQAIIAPYINTWLAGLGL